MTIVTRPNSTDGFTLIEVLVAFAILAISLGALLQLTSTALNNSAEARSFAIAAALAEGKLEGLGVTDMLEEGEFAGDFDGDYRWRLSVRATESGANGAAGVRLFEVSLDVSWPNGLDERRIRVETLKLAPTRGE